MKTGAQSLGQAAQACCHKQSVVYTGTNRLLVARIVVAVQTSPDCVQCKGEQLRGFTSSADIISSSYLPPTQLLTFTLARSLSLCLSVCLSLSLSLSLVLMPFSAWNIERRLSPFPLPHVSSHAMSILDIHNSIPGKQPVEPVGLQDKHLDSCTTTSGHASACPQTQGNSRWSKNMW